MFCHTKPNVTQTNFYKLHPKLHPYQHEVDRPFQNYYARSLLLGKTFCIISHQLGSFPPSLFLDASACLLFPCGARLSRRSGHVPRKDNNVCRATRTGPVGLCTCSSYESHGPFRQVARHHLVSLAATAANVCAGSRQQRSDANP